MEEIFVKKVKRYMKDTWDKDVKCPICGSIHMNVSYNIFELNEFRNNDIATINPNFNKKLVIPVTCGNCGNVLMIDPVATGLLKYY